MGLIDFVKSAGQKIFGGAEASAEEQADKIYQYLRTYNLRTEGINASYDKDTSTIRVIGKAGSMLERKRIVATLGNIEGCKVGFALGNLVGMFEGLLVGIPLGKLEGNAEGVMEGKEDGWTVGTNEGAVEGIFDGIKLGTKVSEISI